MGQISSGELNIYLRRTRSSPVQDEEMELEYPRMRAVYIGNLIGGESISQDKGH